MFQGFNKAAIGSDAVDSCTCTKRVSCFSKSHDTNHVTSVILHVIATLSNPSAVTSSLMFARDYLRENRIRGKLFVKLNHVTVFGFSEIINHFIWFDCGVNLLLYCGFNLLAVWDWTNTSIDQERKMKESGSSPGGLYETHAWP